MRLIQTTRAYQVEKALTDLIDLSWPCRRRSAVPCLRSIFIELYIENEQVVNLSSGMWRDYMCRYMLRLFLCVTNVPWRSQKTVRDA